MIQSPRSHPLLHAAPARPSPRPRRSARRAPRPGVARPAVVAFPALALQLVLRAHPQWRGRPVAVVTAPGPAGLVVEANPAARRCGVRSGSLHGIARRRVPQLRTEVVPQERIDAVLDELRAALGAFAEGVAPHPQLRGVFLLDPGRLRGVYGGLRAWARVVHGYLTARGFAAAVVVGFDPDRAAAIACASHGPFVLEDREQERRRLRGCPLEALPLGPELRAALRRDGVDHVGELLDRPAAQVLARWGPGAARLHAAFAEGPQLAIGLPVEVEDRPRCVPAA